MDTKVAAFFGQLESLGISAAMWASNLVISPSIGIPRTKQPEMVGYRAQRPAGGLKLYQLDKLQPVDGHRPPSNPVADLNTASKSPQVIKEQARLGAVADATSKAVSTKAFGMKQQGVQRRVSQQFPVPVYSRAMKAAARCRHDGG